MYLQIGLHPQDRKYHQFLWRSMNQAKQPDVFEFHSLVFGVNSAPIEAKFIFQEYAMELRDYYPLATDTELNSTYMEDTMGSVADENRGIKLYKELSALWEKAGMHERKWLSNSANVLEKIHAKDRANDVDLSKEYTPSVKTLGLLWIAKEDQLTYHSVAIEAGFNFTKRNLRRKTSSLFDQLWFLAPYITRAKVLMQNVWVSGIDWDEQLGKDCQLSRITNGSGMRHPDTHTEPSQWRYVTTKINPADKITRGMAVKDMQNLSYWWSGPEFLGKTEDECPSRQIIPKEAVKKQKGPHQKFTNVSQKDGKK